MEDYTTVGFKFDVLGIEVNPHKVITPFGLPHIISRGNVFQERDNLEAENARLREAVKKAYMEGWADAHEYDVDEIQPGPQQQEDWNNSWAKNTALKESDGD